MKTLTASALALAVLMLSIGGADAHTRKKKVHYGHKHYAGKHVKPQVRGWLLRGGGYAYGYENEPFLRTNGPYGNYPYFDDRNFWERVQSDPHSTRPGISAY
jgi:hypothetical protein